MKLPIWLKWAICQALGTVKGNMVLSFLEGPLGAIIDAAAKGGPSSVLEKADAELQRVARLLSGGAGTR